ncbi:MAG: polysaccharide biosynthesis protein [Candidatus Staskawiczbacteria bacterium RIFOXYC1_FULL_37_43]|nr:MAG: polysaccharide biosynthesis protein [Candidatus Staskawiczbacteria bacterium RIFCSPHIGHO2_01_FULL_37_17]OGZ72073.1 MAG: polysaccharide biosynthesis protein [Candidatus Staskawiczbacteria bacterium RIFCSPLOWO2_01_FULL_37_19]OGZ75761.1 MAG: polysaccharide biosynthesis protein [Candidatus Staskawiczbacteria bacterium RIFOXYA1_FULL_37_15]OGZ77188.1 MAG: polysaccharide biosynthesis protein [Candidatus Staskawiczbacteria bacterium RIFOXYA12_FULL_37_10]OGZ80651.1 MAG: polysaccharide biosynthes
MIPLSKADITKAEINGVLKVLKSNQLSIGPKLTEFEEAVAKYVGVKYAVAVNSGTSALHLIIRAIGVKEGDEVITSPFSFIASANCILFEGAKPVFVDIKPDTLNINPKLVDKAVTSKTKAILAPDMFAHPANWGELQKIAKKHELFLIEDSAESLGTLYKGKKCGSFGDVSIFAFSPNKQITTGEGGMILTDDKNFAGLCRSMASHGRKIKGGKWLEHVRLGYNYRLNEMSCAVGLSQVKRIETIIKKRSSIANLYNKKLKEIDNIEVPYVAKDVRINWWVYVIKLIGGLGDKRDIIMRKLLKRGIGCRDYFQPIHLQPFYKELFGYKKGDFPIAENISKRTLALPFFSDLSEKEIDFVVKNLKEVLKTV